MQDLDICTKSKVQSSELETNGLIIVKKHKLHFEIELKLRRCVVIINLGNGESGYSMERLHESIWRTGPALFPW